MKLDQLIAATGMPQELLLILALPLVGALLLLVAAFSGGA